MLGEFFSRLFSIFGDFLTYSKRPKIKDEKLKMKKELFKVQAAIGKAKAAGRKAK